MNMKDNHEWETLAREFLGDRRMLETHCFPETRRIYMELGRCMANEAKHVYFLTHRDELPALHDMEAEYNHSFMFHFSSNWLEGLRLLLAWRLGYPDPVYSNCFRRLFDFETIGFGRIPELNSTFMKIGGRYYSLNVLKKEQLEALQHSDLAKLRLFVDLAPEPGRKLRQLIFLAIRNSQYREAVEMMKWVSEYKNAIDDKTFAILVKNVYLLGLTQDEFLKKLQNLDEDPVLKAIVASEEFRSKWFSWLMSAKLLDYSIMKQLMKMGFPSNIPFNPNPNCFLEDYDPDFHERNTLSPSVREIMLAFRDVTPFVVPPLTEYLAANKEYLEVDEGESYGRYKDILFYCRLAEAFFEQGA